LSNRDLTRGRHLLQQRRAFNTQQTAAFVKIRFAQNKDELAASSRFDRSDVDLSHPHHRFERAPCRCSVGIGYCGCQGAWRDLPRQSPLVLAPAACAFLAAVSDNRVP
jgi:hypothetical protein